MLKPCNFLALLGIAAIQLLIQTDLLAQDERAFTIAVLDLDAVLALSAAGQVLANEPQASQERSEAEVDRRRQRAQSGRQ